MAKPEKSAKQSSPLSVNFIRHPQGHVQVDVTGPRSKLSYTGHPEGLRGIMGRLAGKNVNTPKQK